jgi:hypothetical protein
MPTPTTRLGLLKPSTVDAFSTSDLAANWQKLDDTPGTKIVTSTTRPTTWGAAQNGMQIVESDTGLAYRWTGSAWVRSAAKGLLTTTTGGRARAQRTTTISTSTYASLVDVLTLPNVVVPGGNRTLMITATWNQAQNSAGCLLMAISRSGTALAQWLQAGDSTSPSAGAQGQGGSFVTYEPNGLAAGTYTWTLQFRSTFAYKGTSYILADATTPIEIAVIEI